MPIARFQMPDGRVARFEVPEGTTPDQAQTMMQAHFAAPAPVSTIDQIPGARRVYQQPVEKPGILGSTVGGLIETPMAIGANLISGPVTYLAGALGPDVQRKVAEEITYQPRTQMAQSALEAVGRGLEATKLPPYMGPIAGGNMLAESLGPAADATANALAATRQAAGNVALNTATGLGGFTMAKPAAILKEAFKAGKTGDVKFTGAMRGADTMDETLAQVKNAISDIQTANSAAYKTAKTGWAADKTTLDFAPIEKAMSDAEASLQEAGHSKIGTTEQNKVAEVRAVVDEWKQDPAAHNTLGLDALKQRIDAIYPDSPKQTQAQRVISQVRNAVKDTITAQAPDYAAAMKDYETQLSLVRDINKALGTSDKTAKESAINKLMSLMKESPSMDYKRNLLEQAGITDVFPAVSGQQLSGIMPSGMGRVSAMGVGGAAFLAHHPELALAVPFTSPRVMGEMFYGAGKVSAAKAAALNALQQRMGASNLQGLSPLQLNALLPAATTTTNQNALAQ